MKRIFLFGMVLWSVLFGMAVVLTRPEAANSEDDAVIAVSAVDGEVDMPMTKPTKTSEKTYDNTKSIRVRDGAAVREIRMDVYLAGVVAAEMPASFAPEALKAQAVAARTFAARREAEFASGNGKEGHGDAVICTDPGCCMAYCDLTAEAATIFGSNSDTYTEKVKQAVADTDGMILTDENVPILAAFHAISGGYTENASDVWGSDVPYLVSVASFGEENAAKYRGSVTVTADRFRELFLSVYPDAALGDDPTVWFADAVRGDGGGVKTVSVGGVTVKGAVIRTMLDLYSTDFTVSVGVDEDGALTLTFDTLGYGHGVGMSQYGAQALAQQGKTHEEILKTYYTGVKLDLWK